MSYAVYDFKWGIFIGELYQLSDIRNIQLSDIRTTFCIFVHYLSCVKQRGFARNMGQWLPLFERKCDQGTSCPPKKIIRHCFPNGLPKSWIVRNVWPCMCLTPKFELNFRLVPRVLSGLTTREDKHCGSLPSRVLFTPFPVRSSNDLKNYSLPLFLNQKKFTSI